MLKLIHTVLGKEDVFQLYENLINDNIWELNRSTRNHPAGVFPGCTLIDKGEPRFNHPYWIGYFTCLFDRLNEKLNE